MSAIFSCLSNEFFSKITSNKKSIECIIIQRINLKLCSDVHRSAPYRSWTWMIRERWGMTRSSPWSSSYATSRSRSRNTSRPTSVTKWTRLRGLMLAATTTTRLFTKFLLIRYKILISVLRQVWWLGSCP